MLVALIGKNTIYKINLPNIIAGTYYLLNEANKKIINIDGIDGKWKINSNNNVKIIAPNVIDIYGKNVSKSQLRDNVVSTVNLREYMMQYVYVENTSEIYLLYCSPILEDYMCLDIKKSSEILIGRDRSNHIIIDNQLINKKQAKIFYSNGILFIENYDVDFGTFINNKPVGNKRRFLFNGDVIFIMGLKIIIMGRKIFINNPFNKVTYSKNMFEINKEKDITFKIEPEDEDDIEIYSEEDYFAKAPRITNLIEREKVKIDAPPQIQSKEKMPLFYVLGSSFAMGLVSMISMVSAIDGLKSGTASTKDTIFSLSMSGAMLLSMILFPILNEKYERKQKVKYEETRQARYKKYINSKIKLIDEIMNKQRRILYENYASAEECAQIVHSKGARLWEREIEDEDFLSVRIGIGNIPLDADIQYPEEQFTMEDDNLLDTLNTIVNKSKILKNVPVTLSLTEKRIAALIIQNDDRLVEKFLQSVIMQIIALHSYEDVKLVFFVKKNSIPNLEHMKMLPHLWDNTRQIRFFADDYDDMREISAYLEQDLNYRLGINEDVDYRSFKPYYVIITNDYKKIENLEIITNILKSKVNVGFSIFCVANNMVELPNECQTFIEVKNRNGKMYDNRNVSQSQRNFEFDDNSIFFFERISKELSNIPIKYTASKQMALPSTYTFLEMYDVGRIEGLNILERWKRNDTCISLKAPVGIDPVGMPIYLDIHEKAHGPHGLIAGGTGSGKSEFIITYILSMAINYHPNDVAFILIDYKGGGLAGAFQKKSISLPHLVGTITNIDTIGLQRSLASIHSELRKRQVMFNEARNKTDEGTIDIYKYQKLYHEGMVKKPIPHLLIICDEFAELKQQQEEFMDEIISVARIGRSLGVHLILATQKPAGIVDDQIRSNSKFGICLKVQDKEDSMDVIKRPDAAELKKPGQFYIQVGNNEYFTIGQSAWSGAAYYPSDVTKKKVDNSIGIISNTGKIVKQIDIQKKEVLRKDGEQLTCIVKYIYNLAKEEKIVTENLWIDNIPENIYVDSIRKKYNIKNEENIISTIIGEYDDPSNQRQGALILNLSKNGNTLIFGNAESGKETLLSTTVYDLITNYSPEEVQLYLLDFGSEALKIFKQSPQVGDVVFLSDSEKIKRFFEMIQKEITRRVNIISNYGGNYNLYTKMYHGSMPMNVVIINNYETFAESYDTQYDDIVLTLTREGPKYGIIFIFTASNPSDIRYRLSQNFKQKIALQLNNEDDYYNIYDNVGKKRPTRMFGRGLVKLEDIYEFQTAKICKADVWNDYIKETIDNLNKNYKTKARKIPVMPKKVELRDIKPYIKDLSKLPIGINKSTLDIFSYNFTKNLLNIVTSRNLEYSIEFIKHLMEEIKVLKNVNVVIIDEERALQVTKTNNKLNYKNFILGAENNINANIKNMCIIIGIDKFISNLENGEIEFLEDLNKMDKRSNYNFIIVENSNKLKNHEYEEWYKNYISGDNGIWIGKGVDDQYLINISSDRKELENNCEGNIAHVIEEGEVNKIKVVGIGDKE